MGFTYHNITGSDSATLISLNLNNGLLRGGNFNSRAKSNVSFGDNNIYMNLANVHDTDSVDVDLYLQTSDKNTLYNCSPTLEAPYGEDSKTPCLDANSEEVIITEYSYYILKDVTIPVNVTLRLDKEDLLFDNSLYRLRIQLSASDSAVDVIINKIN